MLGDGVGTAGYEKRLVIRDYLLAETDSVIEVTLPEAMASEQAGTDLDDIEAAAIETADVVLCIEAPDRPPLGLYTEFARYFRAAEADKWYRICSIDQHDPSDHPSLVARLADRVASMIDYYHYREDEWEPCNVIREACVRRVRQAVERRLQRRLEQSLAED